MRTKYKQSVILFVCISIRLLCEPYNVKDIQIMKRRLSGAMITSENIFGPRMCIADCLRRFPYCLSANYNREKLECQLNARFEASHDDGIRFIATSEFSFIDVAKLSDKEKRMGLQSLGMNQTQDKNYICTTLKSKEIECVQDIRPRDCKDLRIHGSMISGVYMLYPKKNVVIRAYCDMTKDNGGWTAFQRRTSGSVDFFRSWDDYKKGFGDINGNHWLGNDYLHLLLSNGESEMRMDMEDFDGNTGYIQYSSFVVGNEASDYQATLQGPSGNVSDCLTNSTQEIHSTRFVTKDRDVNDCANTYKGGWWYVSCHCTNPNGLYLSGQTSIHAKGMVYRPWLGNRYSLKSFSMMIRRES